MVVVRKSSSLWLNDSTSGSLINYSINALIVGKDVASGRVFHLAFQNNPIGREKCLKDLEDSILKLQTGLE
ncbi:ASN_collapsed_G0048080.mRNA.1.CDS.1 [Saccharomyces cerevisiae]|nr:ASN_collapsed_G0048080.mRNA.1.CDS.1 [Saccharomyces cerevisiae]